uniref:Uncharacterized protein n=1 Tax=Steinernema glaseri TaxID=37863 RepID=A0A1I7YBY9_9BILA
MLIWSIAQRTTTSTENPAVDAFAEDGRGTRKTMILYMYVTCVTARPRRPGLCKSRVSVSGKMPRLGRDFSDDLRTSLEVNTLQKLLLLKLSIQQEEYYSL